MNSKGKEKDGDMALTWDMPIMFGVFDLTESWRYAGVPSQVKGQKHPWSHIHLRYKKKMTCNTGYHWVALYDTHLHRENWGLLPMLNPLPQICYPDRNHTWGTLL